MSKSDMIGKLLVSIQFFFAVSAIIDYCASAILILISLAHTFGGLSWYFKSEAYSNTIFAISAITVMMAIMI